MKKVSRNIFLFVIVLVFFLGLAPRFFIIDKVQETIAEQISKSLDSSVTIKRMHWVWLPLPHLTLVNTTVTNTDLNISLPKVKIYPSWRIILGEISKPGKILLDSPEILVAKSAFLPGGTGELVMPEVALIIKNGRLKIEATEELKEILRSDSLTLSSIRGKLKLLPLKAEVDLQASSPFSRNISLHGIFTMPEKNYRFSLDAQDITLHKSFKAFLKGHLLPVESTARLAGTFSGKGLQQFEGALHGTLPCFAVKPQDREVLLTCGFADMKLLRAGPLLRLDINDLEIKDPQVNLSGHIERKLSAMKSEEQSSAAEAIWTLDIIGSDLDLTAMRQKILTLWSDNAVAAIVSDIVRGGRALSAAYGFSGRAADFKKLDAMVIKADILNAALHVPGAELDLSNASGPIQIKNSILTGSGLSAQLENSYGRNAELLLDIGTLGKTFKLAIDIDADLAALPPILAQLVQHEGFQRELHKFKETSGKASGTVHLGDSLDDIITRVDVKNMELATRYDPIPRPILINGGALHVGPEDVSWDKVKGFIGRQKITSTSGNVSWKTGEPLLHIEKIRAKLEGASLHALLRQTGVLEKKINHVLSSLNGTIELTGGSLQGKALSPDSWEYDLGLATKGLTLTSPLLPEQVSTNKLTAEIKHNEANLHNADIQFLDETFNLKGLFKHHLLEDWYGMIEYNGPVKAKLASWIRSKGWFPEKLQPRIPCTMENMRVDWQGKTVEVSGIVLQGLGGGRLPMVKINYENSPEHLHINELSFFAPGEEGRLGLDFWRLSPHSLVLSWDGFVNADTIDALFEHSSFAAGSLSGDFSISYFADKPEATSFEGLLKAENLLFKTKSNHPPNIITSFDLKGVGRQLRIPALELAIGSERITGLGQLAADKEGLQLDISLASSFLSRESLTHLLLAAQESQHVFFQDDLDQEPGLQIARGWDITGRVGFDFDSFALNRKTTSPYDEPQSVTYTFYDMHGDLQLAPDKISRTEVFSAKLCGLDFRGVWFSDDSLGQKIHLNTNQDETLRLENVLPCLGVQQDIIEGDFSLRSNFLKESNTWYGGNIHIKSSKGRILRLKTLSRIFRVVNITDLFEAEVGNTGSRGFPFSQMDIDTHIEANNLIIDRAIILGEGLNLFTRGQIHLDDFDADLTLLIAPFKTFDTIVAKVPIIGQPIMGEYGSRMSLPVAVKGPIADPTITPLHPEAIGDAFFNLVKDTFMLPYNIIKPFEQSGESSSEQAEGK